MNQNEARALRLEANESFETTRHHHANQVLVGNHSHMACETRCGRNHPTVICSKCKFRNEHIMGNPITSATGKPKWITSIQTWTDIHTSSNLSSLYQSTLVRLCIYLSNNQSIFPYLDLAIHPFVHLHIHLFLYAKNTSVSTTASTLLNIMI